MENHQNLAVVIEQPNGARVKMSVQVVGGPIRDEAELHKKVIALGEDGAKLLDMVRLDKAGNPVPDHPVLGPFITPQERAGTPESADLTKNVPPLPSPIPPDAKPEVTPPVRAPGGTTADGGLVAQ